MRKAVVFFALLALVVGVSAGTAQTCGGGLFCNTPSDAYTISNVTGNGLAGQQGGPCNSIAGLPVAGVLGASPGNDGVVGIPTSARPASRDTT